MLGNFYYSSQVEAVGPAYYTGSFQIGPSSPAPLPYILQQAKTKGQSHNTKEENKRTEEVGASLVLIKSLICM